ncbi:MAG: NAD(+) synthase [bacterium]|nr:NAD(+) synthase [bacterium]
MALAQINIAEVHNKLVEAIREFFANCGAKRAAVGFSGGIDSAVVGALAVEALGKENVHALMMPSEFSTLHSIQDAVDLAENLGIGYHIVEIAEIYKQFMEELAPVFGPNNKWNVAEENLQARIRGTLLMAYANKFGALVLNTSNKSELCMGYGTLYGDLAGAVMVIADLYKTEVYQLAAHINRKGIIIPLSTITKAPSAELRVGQKDSDSLPDYAILDELLYKLRELGMSYDEVLAQGADKEALDRVCALLKGSAFKAHQVPPLFNVSGLPVAYKEKWLL